MLKLLTKFAFMPQIKEFREAAGLGFEPRLTDPESFSFRDTGGHGGIGGDKTALLSGIERH